ncbi:MAG: TRAP transporter small permease subunit, partial [Burkholderiales bacterium]
MTGQPPAPLGSLIRALDAFAERTGWLVAWLIVPLAGAMVYEVVARYFFRAPTVWAQDLSYMLYGALFMLGGAYTLRHGGHIRTDFLYNKLGVRGQAFIDAVAYLFFF